jgi:EAL domain-containing protein (putative c-di-GMP-specific phosphodiesterase class I)
LYLPVAITAPLVDCQAFSGRPGCSAVPSLSRPATSLSIIETTYTSAVRDRCFQTLPAAHSIGLSGRYNPAAGSHGGPSRARADLRRLRSWPGGGALRAGPDRARVQPIVDLAHGVLTGYEALARFDADPRATPDRWFAAATQLGVVAELEAAVIRRALAKRAVLPQNCFMSINVGPHAIGADSVQRTFADAGELAGVVIELTEQAAVNDYEALNAAFAPLRAAGAVLAVDDAGAGFASLRHIADLRPGFVKVDRELVAGLDRDPAKAAIVECSGSQPAGSTRGSSPRASSGSRSCCG